MCLPLSRLVGPSLPPARGGPPTAGSGPEPLLHVIVCQIAPLRGQHENRPRSWRSCPLRRTATDRRYARRKDAPPAAHSQPPRSSRKATEPARCADPRRSGGTGGVVATRESNIIMFPQPIDPERKEDVRIAEQFLEKIDGLIMKGLRGDLAAAEARVLAGDSGAAGDAEFLFLSIRRRLRDRDAIRREVIAKYVLARAALDF